VPACNAAAVVPLITDDHSAQKHQLEIISLEYFNLIITSEQPIDQNTSYPTCLHGESQQRILGKANHMVRNCSY